MDVLNKLFSNTVGIAFVITCLIAVGILVYERLKGNKHASDQLGGGFVRLFLVFVALIVTRGTKVEPTIINHPWIGIVAFILIEVFFEIWRILHRKFPAVKIMHWMKTYIMV